MNGVTTANSHWLGVPTVQWLLGLDSGVRGVPEGTTGVSVVFEHPMAGWAWFLAMLCLCAFAVWTYARLQSPTRVRVALGALRFFLLALILLAATGPSLRFAREQTERDHLIVLLDRSRSMGIGDGVEGRTRDVEMIRALEGASAMFETVSTTKEIDWLGFGGGAFPLGASATRVLADIPTATADETNLDSALTQAIARLGGRPLSAILILSDGRTATPVSRETLTPLRDRGIKVFVVPFGSKDPIGDASLESVHAPPRAFIRDRVPVRVQVDRGAYQGTLRATLIDDATGATLDTQEVRAGVEEIVLDAARDTAGDVVWRVALRGDPEDLVAANNTQTIHVSFVDRPLRVLYLDGSARWEFRYFKNLLLREPSIEASTMLLSADRDFAQEGNIAIARVPRTKEEFAPYDLFVIGDVPSGFFSPEQLEIMRAQVAERGAGLLWIGGEHGTPSSWEGTALADLLPFSAPFNLGVTKDIKMEPTTAASALGLLRLAPDEDGEGRDGDGWPNTFSASNNTWSTLRWAQVIPDDQLKPTAEVLAVGVAVSKSLPASQSSLPLVLRMRFGAGETIYVATDEIWRWRYGQGERLHERFWLPMVRMLAREALMSGESSAALLVEPRRATLGDRVAMRLRLRDESLANTLDASIPLEVRNAEGEIIAVLDALRDGAEARTTWYTDTVGSYTIVATSAVIGEVSATLEVVRRSDELRDTTPDHVALGVIADATNGATIEPATLRDLAPLLPLRAVTTDAPVFERLWDTPLFLILFFLLPTLEWVGRRQSRLA